MYVRIARCNRAAVYVGFLFQVRRRVAQDEFRLFESIPKYNFKTILNNIFSNNNEHRSSRKSPRIRDLYEISGIARRELSAKKRKLTSAVSSTYRARSRPHESQIASRTFRLEFAISSTLSSRAAYRPDDGRTTRAGPRAAPRVER